MNLKRLANLFAIALISAATLTACGEDDVIDNDDQTIVDDTSEPDKDDDDNQGTGEDTDSNEELKVALLTDYVKDSDTFFFSNGVAINVSQDEETEGYYLFIDSLSFETGEWVEGKDLMAYCDPEFRPICATNAAGDKLFFTYADNNTFSVTYANANGETKEHTGIQMPEQAQPAKMGSRASTDTDYLDYLGKGLTILDTGLSIIEKDRKSVKLNIASLILAFTVDGLTGDMASLALSEIAVNTVKTGALGYAGLVLADIQAVQHAIEWRIKIEIGDVTTRIAALEVEGENTVNVLINFSNVSPNTKSIPLYYVKYWQEVDGKRVGEVHQTGTKEITKEGDIIEPVTNLAPGTYAFQVVVYPSSFISDFIIKIYNFQSNVMRISTVSFAIKPTITDVSYSPGYNWDNERTINVAVDIKYDMSNNVYRILNSSYKGYGAYLRMGDQSPQLFAHGSGGVQSLPYHDGLMHFSIANDYPYLTLDYNTYEAIADNIKIGAYAIDKEGEVHYFNEQDLKIIYNYAPNIKVGATYFAPNSIEFGANVWITTMILEGALWIEGFEIFNDVFHFSPPPGDYLWCYDNNYYNVPSSWLDYVNNDYQIEEGTTVSIKIYLKNGNIIENQSIVSAPINAYN